MLVREAVIDAENPGLKKNEPKKTFFCKIIHRLIEIIREKDPPPRIAFGMALGIFVGMLPIMGIQMVVVSLFALPLRANLKAALVGVWISNPITFIPMYYGCYRFGLLFTSTPKLTWEAFKKLLELLAWDWSQIPESLGRLVELSGDILMPLWVGSLILGVILAVPTYFITFWFVVGYRTRLAAHKKG